MNTTLLAEPEIPKKVTHRYLEQVSPVAFRCKPALQQIYMDTLPGLKGINNPLHIYQIFKKAIPAHIPSLFQRLLFYVGNPGYIILLDLPKECALENSFSAALTSLVSFPVAYPGEGELVISIKPRRNSAANPSFANSKEFFLHTDLSYVPIMPDVLTMCVKNIAINGGGESLVATVAEIQNLLHSEVYHQLRKNQFHFDAPAHYKTEYDTNSAALPIISYSTNGLRVRYRYDKVKAETKAGEEAIEVFNAMANIKTEKTLLPRYSAIILNQRFAMHGRTEFVPTYDENDRELTRSYGTICLAKFKAIDYATGYVQC